MFWTIVGSIIGGVIIGLLGKFVAPGNRDSIPLWLTVLCGIGGIFLGSYLYFAIFDVADNVKNNADYDWLNTSKGVDWWRHVWQIGAAAVLVVVAATATGRAKKA
ncbi:hypothetical protein EFK50_00905 [Nocardioides marmoriginsengisoli]|uniref:GlsB/YeaQ/YmgE family stress response membrane protein n=1 Tax=Nocardioides marmoriginsengisoli TaxID=661483 RepID=A0A3N0CT89_9ACTN|nr:hypothetical protein [Nocardioides marmoriginsengisoli]RNL66216.1 hypothetical protein EFK50_00905 [Nocardioides marmoriginsengisoli]